jgi:Protein of unknown function (DUF2889)
VTAERYLDPSHGPHEPTSGSPTRRPGSVRRTTTVDSLRPNEADQRLTLLGRGRDLITYPDGRTEVAATASSHIEIAYTAGPVVQSVTTEPVVTGAETLVGRVASTGFRAAIDAGTSARHGSLVYLLLDEIPVSTLVSGYAVLHARSRGDLGLQSIDRMRPPGPPAHGENMCAGFRAGGTIMSRRALGDHALVTGPDATSLFDPADPYAWHDMPGPLRPDAMRRWRRIDVWRVDPKTLGVETFFRDSHMAPDGVETIIHEYTVAALVDSDDLVITAAKATGRVLPFFECPGAIDSGGRLVGMPINGLRQQVRNELVGPSTCTHLNDQLREIEDVETLRGLLPEFDFVAS